VHAEVGNVQGIWQEKIMYVACTLAAALAHVCLSFLTGHAFGVPTMIGVGRHDVPGVLMLLTGDDWSRVLRWICSTWQRVG
jgi:hypothetical protein